MSVRFTSSVLVAALLVASSAFASAADLRLAADTLVGSTEVAKGSYKVAVSTSGTELTISRGKKVVATVPCTVGPLTTQVPVDMATFTKTPEGKLRLARVLLADTKQEVRVTPAS